MNDVYFRGLEFFLRRSNRSQASHLSRFNIDQAQAAGWFMRGINNSSSKTMNTKRVLSYEDMLKVIHQPEKVIIDVRNPDEVHSTGKIPSSINIPLNNVQDALTSMSDEEFQKQFQRNKPTSSDELIFYCQSGRRSTEALDKALKLGYSNSKNYPGSWNEWSSKHKN